LAVIKDIVEIPGGYSVIVELSNGKEIRLNFNTKMFMRLTDEELERLIRNAEEEFVKKNQPTIEDKIKKWKGKRIDV